MTESDLAVNGGPRVRERPWPDRRRFGPDDKAAVDALFDESISTGRPFRYDGPSEEAFCREFAEFMGGGFVDGVSSGSTALYVALKALGVEPFTEVIVGCLTDPGGMMPIPLLNCIPMVADVAPGSLSPGPDQIEELVTPYTSAIVVAHIAGYPADVKAIAEVARRHGIPLVEDCAQSHGAQLDGRYVGTFGQLATVSTMWDKHMNTGGQGGVVFTRDEDLYRRSRRASDRGKPFFLPEGSTNEAASLNLNLSDLAGAIGRVQVGKLAGQVERRRQVVSALEAGIADLGLESVTVLQPILGAVPSYWWLPVRVNSEQFTCDRGTFLQALAAEGVPATGIGWRLMPHRMEWFRQRRVFGTSRYPWASADYRGNGDREFHCPNADVVMADYMKLPVHDDWSEAEIGDVITALSKVERAFMR